MYMAGAFTKANLPVCLVSTKCDVLRRQLNPNSIEHIVAANGSEQIQTSVLARDSQKQCIAAILSMISRKNGSLVFFYTLPRLVRTEISAWLLPKIRLRFEPELGTGFCGIDSCLPDPWSPPVSLSREEHAGRDRGSSGSPGPSGDNLSQRALIPFHIHCATGWLASKSLTLPRV